MSKSSGPFAARGSNWNFRVSGISLWYEGPSLPLRRVKSHTWRSLIDSAALRQKKVPPLWDERAMLPKLRFKEAKSAFMGNYANLCCEIGVAKKKKKAFHLRTVAKLPPLIGNLFGGGLVSPLVSPRWQEGHIYFGPEVTEVAAGGSTLSRWVLSIGFVCWPANITCVSSNSSDWIRRELCVHGI